MYEVYEIITKSEIAEFDMLTEGLYKIPIKLTGNRIVDYLTVYLSYFEDINKFLQDEKKHGRYLIYFHQTQVTLTEHYEPFKWIRDIVYRRFVK